MPTEVLSVVGAILVGGRSRRMGRPKHNVEIDGVSMLEHVSRALRDVCDDVVLLGEAADLPEGYTRVHDDRPGDGPLAGIEACLASGRAASYIICSCDMPRLTGRLLRRLLGPGPDRVRVFRHPTGNTLEPLPMRVRPAALGIATARLDRGARSLRGFLDEVRAATVSLRPDEVGLLENVNRL
ncbi:MAG: molybdenum cofactor guanylyltransferase [Planctomycetota bacterium]|jgi:molybdopterin-guanine dinucleotide biosynthesis protein A